jgi:glutamate dehydrogenase (NAD(P)+)
MTASLGGRKQGDVNVRSYREIVLEDEAAGFGAYLVVNSSDRDISFGGTRIDASVTREMVVELAENMSLKLAGHGSPVGGAKAGLRASPDDPRLKQFLGRFAEACRELLTTTTVLGKDMGARQWMLDEIYRTLDLPQLGVVQKHGHANGCPDRLSELGGYVRHMTGRGVFWSVEQALGEALRGARVLVQGFGVVGAGAAWHLERAGARIVGVSDARKAVLAPDGIGLELLLAARDENGLLAGSKLPCSSQLAARDELLAQPADVLVLAAGSYLVGGDVAADVRASLVVEAANLALRPDAARTLHARAVRVVPDVVANSASAALVGRQMASGNTLPPQALWAEIEASIKRNTEAVERVSRRHGIDSKSAFRHFMMHGDEGAPPQTTAGGHAPAPPGQARGA